MDEDMKNQIMMEKREFMKGYHQNEEEIESDQHLKLPQPPLQVSRGGKIISLPKGFEDIIVERDLMDVFIGRKSLRKYASAPITLKELSFLLWASQGVKEQKGDLSKANARALRLVPSAGCRHAMETYLGVNNVEGLKSGVYHYLALEHALEYMYSPENLSDLLTNLSCGQVFFGMAPVAFLWTAVPYRSEWRYTSDAQKYMLLDAGHACQNLYLASEAIGAGTCAIGAYIQEEADSLLKLESGLSFSKDDEFVIYMASVGKKGK